MIKPQPASKPAYLKMGFYGDTGTGKTFTAVKVLSQFIKKYTPGKHLAMFDTEPSAGYVADMVKQITGKELLVVTSRSFSELVEFSKWVKEEKHVALLDSATHPWRSLMQDYLNAKRSRVSSAGGRTDTVSLSLKDWGPIKEIWGNFSQMFCYDPVHWCMCGREGDRWDTVTDSEGNEELKKIGTKMKTETETGYEPSILIRMSMFEVPNKPQPVHRAFVCKDRFNTLTGQYADDPDIEFFLPHLKMLALGGKSVELNPDAPPAFTPDRGPNWETIQARREAALENIKDDMLLALPGMDAESKKAKVSALREAFGTSAWTELEKDHRKYPLEILEEGRTKLNTILPKEQK